jgi:hypothetical protein
MNTNTYYVSSNGGVKRLENLAGVWYDVNITAGGIPYTQELFDVETDTNNGDKVFVVGQSQQNVGVLNGLFVSSNKGVTWTSPTGTILLLNSNTIYEVCVINSLNIVVCISDAYVASSIDGGITFNLLPRLPKTTTFFNATLQWRNITSVNFITPLIGVVGSYDRVFKTINGGLTWFEPTGGLFILDAGYNSGPIVGIHLSANQQTIILTGLMGGVYVSTNAGVNYTRLLTFSGGAVHLTWLNDLELWAYGPNEERIKTIDGGINWITISPYNPAPTAYNTIAAHFFSSSKGFFNESNGFSDNLLYTINTGISGVISDTSPRITAVWTHYEAQCYLLTDCSDNTNTFIITNDLVGYDGQVIEVCPTDLPTQPVAPSGGEPIIIDENDPGNTEFTLTSCCDETITRIISNNIGGYDNLVVVIPFFSTTTCWYVNKGATGTSLGIIDLTGSVYFVECNSCVSENPCDLNIPIVLECTCFYIEPIPCYSTAITLTNIGPIFIDCVECVRVCYKLTDCLDDTHVLIVTNDLSPFLAQVISIPQCPGICWTVSEAENCVGSITIENIASFYTTCDECLGIVPPLPIPIILKQRQVVPGYTTKVCTPEYVEKVSCNFAEQIYNIMKVMRYGIATCCENELQKWSIKQELLNLDMLNDNNPVIVCSCYSIQQFSGTNDFQYTNCSGQCTIITVTLASGIIKVCAQKMPTLNCGSTSTDYRVMFLDTECTDNLQCIP